MLLVPLRFPLQNTVPLPSTSTTVSALNTSICSSSCRLISSFSFALAETACFKSQWSSVTISVAVIAKQFGFVIHHIRSIINQRWLHSGGALYRASCQSGLLGHQYCSTPSTQASFSIANACAQIIYLLGQPVISKPTFRGQNVNDSKRSGHAC